MSMIPVLDKGYVRLLDHMGDDLMVVNAARASFDAESQWRLDQRPAKNASWDPAGRWSHYETHGKYLSDGDQRLIRFCAREKHFSPFTHPQVHMELKMPGMVLDQWVKHRIGISLTDDEAFQAYQNEAVNQKSMRYKEPGDFYIPRSDEWRSAPENKKQGSGKENLDHVNGSWATKALEETVERGMSAYKTWVNGDGNPFGNMAPEQARLFIPYYAMYTNRRWTSSLYGIINLLSLRLEEDSQFEIREYAHAVGSLVQPLFPYTFRAFGIELPNRSGTK